MAWQQTQEVAHLLSSQDLGISSDTGRMHMASSRPPDGVRAVSTVDSPANTVPMTAHHSPRSTSVEAVDRSAGDQASRAKREQTRQYPTSSTDF